MSSRRHRKGCIGADSLYKQEFLSYIVFSWGVNTRMHVYWGGSELWGVYMHDRNMEDVCNVKIQGCMSMGRGQ